MKLVSEESVLKVSIASASSICNSLSGPVVPIPTLPEEFIVRYVLPFWRINVDPPVPAVI